LAVFWIGTRPTQIKKNTHLFEDPCVISVTRIYNYYKQHGYNTGDMGASFRNIGKLERVLSPENTGDAIAKSIESEARFRYSNNNDAMATEKLTEGIRNLFKDQVNLENLLKKRSK
jgi:transaldolase